MKCLDAGELFPIDWFILSAKTYICTSKFPLLFKNNFLATQIYKGISFRFYSDHIVFLDRQ